MKKHKNCSELQKAHPNRCCGCEFRVEWAKGSVGVCKVTNIHIPKNITDIGWFRWVFDAMDGKKTSWLSNG